MSDLLENRSVREVVMLRPRLRDGLRFSIQEQGGQRVCVIEDPHFSKFHRIGLAEYAFLRELDGTRPVAAIVARMAQSGGGEAFTEAEAMQILRWLNDNHLLAVEATRSGGSERVQTAQRWQRAVAWINPLIFKVPLARPDRFFDKIVPPLKPLFGWPGACVWLAVVITALAQVGLQWPRFTQSFEGILARDNWLWLAVSWIFLKVMHELAHGAFCKHYGAGVREIGVIVVLFVPMGYVDATASLGLPSKWWRIAVSCAGMYLEFFIAALAAIVWVHTDPGLVNTLAHNLVITGTVVTLFFNANPLMRFDGYYILSDLLEIPNLATRGRQFFMGLVGWLLFGLRSMRPAKLSGRESAVVALYGVASAAWQWLVLAGMIAGASALWQGAGIILAVMGAVAWVGIPLARMVYGLRRDAAGQFHGLGRPVLRGAVAAAVVAGVMLVPYHKTVVSHGVTEYADARVVRAECPGFVVKIFVRDGDVVRAGQPLLELRNDEQAAELEHDRLLLRQQQLRGRISYTRADVASFQAEETKAEGMRRALAIKEGFYATRLIRAPMDGRVVNRLLYQYEGAFLHTGDEVLRMGRADGREVEIAISQEHEPHFRAALGGPLLVKVDGIPDVLPATLQRIDAGATRAILHPALTPMAGGAIPLRRAAASGSGETSSRASEYEFAEPHFRGTALLTGDGAAALPAGEAARVKIRSPLTVSLWTELQGVTGRWLRKTMEQRAAN